MIYKIVVIRDIVADVYGTPQFTHNVGSAVRSFGDQCKDKTAGNIVGQHPQDFELYELGEYDDQGAEFILKDAKQIAIGANYKE